MFDENADTNNKAIRHIAVRPVTHFIFSYIFVTHWKVSFLLDCASVIRKVKMFTTSFPISFVQFSVKKERKSISLTSRVEQRTWKLPHSSLLVSVCAYFFVQIIITKHLNFSVCIFTRTRVSIVLSFCRYLFFSLPCA